MSVLFQIKNIDRQFYENRLRDFLPDKIADIHTHVWLEKHRTAKNVCANIVSWPGLVAKDNSIEDLRETYKLMFPDKDVRPLIFTNIEPGDNITAANNYVSRGANKYNLPALIWTDPVWTKNELEEKIKSGGFLGVKPYLSFAPDYIPANEIRIFDFLPTHHLEVLNKYGLMLILHIPRPGRLKDGLNLIQALEIENKFPDIKLIMAHVGRAYCPEDVGDAFKKLSKTKKMMFDFSANTNEEVFTKLIQAVGPKRILFGSDLPITRMRMRRICENGIYINIVPKGLYGDVSGDKNMREVKGREAEKLSFFLYEQIDAFRRAAIATKLSVKDIEDVFYNNAMRVIKKVKNGLN